MSTQEKSWNRSSVVSRTVVVACAILPFRLTAQPPADAPPQGLDLMEKHKKEYAATEKPALVEVGSANYLAVTGEGAPGSESFRSKIGALYMLAYSINMKHRFSGRPYNVGPLEGQWWGSKSKHDFVAEPKDNWKWKLLIRVPEFITQEDLAAAVKQASNGEQSTAAKQVKLETIEEGRCVQILHKGPYEDEPKTIKRMRDFAQAKGYAPRGLHHEIYLSDPNRTPPEKLRTILRQPVE